MTESICDDHVRSKCLLHFRTIWTLCTDGCPTTAYTIMSQPHPQLAVVTRNLQLQGYLFNIRHCKTEFPPQQNNLDFNFKFDILRLFITQG